MTYTTQEGSQGHIDWLHGPGTTHHYVPDLVSRLSAEMRKSVISPKAPLASPIDVMRSEMKRLIDSLGWHAFPISGDKTFPHMVPAAHIIASLDPQCIAYMGRVAGVMFHDLLWEEIAPHLTPEIVSAFCAGSNDPIHLPYPSIRDLAPLPAETSRALIRAWRTPCTNHLLSHISAARRGTLCANLACEALDHYLDRWPVMPFEATRDDGLRLSFTMLRLVAAVKRNAPDTLPLPEAGMHRERDLIALTRTSHGRMRIALAISDLPGFLRDPEPVLARLAPDAPRHTPIPGMPSYLALVA